MRSRFRKKTERALTGLVLMGLVLSSPGCLAFNEGIADALEQDRSSPEEYAWYYELYEFPFGIIGIPLFLALSPGLYWIPGGPGDDFGYPLGRAFGGDFIYIDPTENYR